MRKLMAAAAATATLSGCVQSDPNVYGPYETGQPAYTETGVITSARSVDINSNGGTGIGAVTGAFAGGVLGAQLGPGRSSRRYGRYGYRHSSSAGVVSALGAIGGALVGGLVGAAIERDVTRAKGTEYIIKLDDGQLVTIVQASEPLDVGERVFVQIPQRGRTRVVPAG